VLSERLGEQQAAGAALREQLDASEAQRRQLDQRVQWVAGVLLGRGAAGPALGSPPV
jgi:hypothetical protein